jgi:hypothetical protein
MQPTLNQQLAQVHQAELLADAASNRLAADARRSAARTGRTGRTTGASRFVAAFAGLLGDRVHRLQAGGAARAAKATGAGAPVLGALPPASVTRI